MLRWKPDWQSSALSPGPSAFAVALVEHLPHRFAYDLGQIPRQRIDFPLDSTKSLLNASKSLVNAVEPVFDAIESGLHGRQIIAIAARLLEDMVRHHLLAFHFAFKHANP
jgi:hypothetical protein